MVASMKESEKTPLASLYGAVQGLAELGPEVVKVFVVLYCCIFIYILFIVCVCINGSYWFYIGIYPASCAMVRRACGGCARWGCGRRPCSCEQP